MCLLALKIFCPGWCGSVDWSITHTWNSLQFPVRAHSWVADLDPSWGAYGRQLVNDSLSVNVSLSLSPFLSK